MSSISPPSLPKTPVVVVVVDSSLALDWAHIFHSYLPHLLAGLAEGSLSCPQLRLGVRLGFVTYGPPDCGGSPVLFQRFFAEGARDELKVDPAIIFIGHTCPGSSLGMAALEGYAVAIEVFGILQSGLDQEHSGELSCHLWHFAAGRPDSAKQPRWCFSSTLRNLTWENLPAELKERDINCSMILVRPTPKFEELFFEISDTPITPWFPICKGHTILLSGFSPSLQPGAAALSTIPAKRPAATPAEHGSRGPKFSPQTTIVLEQPALEPSPPIPPIPPPLQELSSTSLTVTPAKVFSSSPPPPAYTPQDPGIIGQQLTADPDPAAIQENHSHTFEPSTLQQAPTLLDLIPSFSIPQPQSPLLNWDAARLLRADLVGIRAKPRKIVAAQAGRGEVNEYPLRCGRQMVEYETGVPMGNGAIAAAQTRQTRHLSHLAPKKNSDSAARLPAQVLAAIPNTVSPRRHINANKVDTGPGFAAYADSTYCQLQIFNSATMQIPPQDNLGDMPAPDALEQRFGMMPQPILPENTQVPRPVGNGDGISPDVCVGATTAGEFDHKIDDQWSRTFMRSRAAMSLRVLIKEPLGNASASTWPSVLSLDFTQYKLSTLELQQWMKDSEAVMVWFAPAAESDVHEFAQLVKWLRERECYAVASWDIQGRGRPTPHLLLVPLGEELIGAAFPTSDMPQLPLPEPRDPLVRRVVIIF